MGSYRELESSIYGMGVDLNNPSLIGEIVIFFCGAIWVAQTVPGEEFIRNPSLTGEITRYGRIYHIWSVSGFPLREVDSWIIPGISSFCKGGTLADAQGSYKNLPWSRL